MYMNAFLDTCIEYCTYNTCVRMLRCVRMHCVFVRMYIYEHEFILRYFYRTIHDTWSFDSFWCVYMYMLDIYCCVRMHRVFECTYIYFSWIHFAIHVEDSTSSLDELILNMHKFICTVCMCLKWCAHTVREDRCVKMHCVFECKYVYLHHLNFLTHVEEFKWRFESLIWYGYMCV